MRLAAILFISLLTALAAFAAMQSSAGAGTKAHARTATTLVRTFGGHGTGDGQLRNPGGLGIGPTGDF